MANIVDQAQEFNEIFLEHSLNNRNRKTIPFSGKCLYCEDPIEKARFCCPECRIDYEALMRRSR